MSARSGSRTKTATADPSSVELATPSSSNVVQTVLPRVSLFKQVVESIKDLVPDAYLLFEPNGVSLTSYDKANVALVHFFLAKEAFQVYQVTPQRSSRKASAVVQIGVSLTELDNILKCLSPGDPVAITYDGTEHLKISSGGSGKWQFEMKLILPTNDQSIQIHDIQFDVTDDIPCIEMNHMVKSISKFSHHVTLARANNRLFFNAKGDGTQRIKSEIELPQRFDRFLSQTYSVDYLQKFAKAGGSSTVVVLSMAEEVPMRVAYHLDGVGSKIEFYLQAVLD